MKKGLNAFQLKIIACVIMVIDHTGVLFFPNKLVFRIIGRLAFPIFAFFISEGYIYTRSVSRYLTRLGVCAVLFQIPDWFSGIYGALFNVPGFGVRYVLNIFSTLFFGLLSIMFFDRFKEKNLWLSFLSIALVASVAEISGADYGAYGVLYIVVFYLSNRNIKNMFIGGMFLNGAYALYSISSALISKESIFSANIIQPFSMLAILLISLYNGDRGRNAKYFFYIFYPAHLIILQVIKIILT